MHFLNTSGRAILVIAIVCLTSQAGAQNALDPALPAPAAASAASAASAPAGDRWRVTASPYTYHFSRDPNHRDVYMLGIETQNDEAYVLGASLFRNSFGQPSAYLYVGKRFEGLTRHEPLFVQLTGGLLYGYRFPYNRKVPLNYRGFSPGAVFSVGWQFTPMLSTQINFLGNSALMLQVSADFH